MGWFHDAWPGHEGLLRGWEKDDYFGLLRLDTPPIHFVCDVQPSISKPRRFCVRKPGKGCCRWCKRRLRRTHPTDAADLGVRERVKVHAVQVECSCEWGSPLLAAPFGTEWHDGLLLLPESARETESTDRLGLVPFEAKCVRLWYEHCRQCGGDTDSRPRLLGEPAIASSYPEPAIDVGANREFVRRYFLKR